jgi:hypothetical protein
MNDPGKSDRRECQEALNQLEDLRLEGTSVGTAAEITDRLKDGSGEHAQRCQDCAAAVDDFLTTREALAGIRGMVPEAGPWFAAKVMAAVRAAEKEIDEKKEGVWISVRRLAPRLSACAALLLVLGGTWAMELRHREAQPLEMRQVEGIFEATPSAAMNDDIVTSASEVSQP